ncbi:hypothetical protein KY285_005350 [Solanum tuberosum]|nr:hypothetical protein KY284_005572 [Solanum tuberosum]KAH0752202.1 hypothetical protein KY285_005350 [Solanum tuberosum]
MTPRKKRTAPTKKYGRQIRTQRQREEEALENTNLKKSIEEEEEGEHEIDVSSTNVERDDRAVEKEQDDIAIPEEETSPIVESSPLSPSPDNFIVKLIRYANYNLESMIDSYDTIIKHLLKAVKTIDEKTTNLYGFPWAFMCWAFEVVPFLQKKYKVFSKQVSSPKIFRWILATNNESINISELFDPPQDSKLTKDDKIEKLEMDLNGVVAIKRDIIIGEHNLDVGGGGASSPIVERVFSGVGDGGGGEFTPNVDRCTDGVDVERGEDFGDISGDFGVDTSSPIDENVPCLQETPVDTQFWLSTFNYRTFHAPLPSISAKERLELPENGNFQWFLARPRSLDHHHCSA